jgi:DNA ligase-1
MPDLRDGESVEINGSARLPYVLKNVGGVYSCSCPAWRNQSLSIERRTCKHIRQYRGEIAEAERLGAVPPVVADPAASKPKVPPVLLAETWDGEQDVTGWWLSEKLDGLRAYWDGKQFVSRQGNVYHAPVWFKAGLPPTPLDGELWLERKAFQRTVSIVRRQDASDLWRQIRYVVFDAPQQNGPFEQRIKHCRDYFRECFCPFADVLSQYVCRSVDHLQVELENVLQLGGEGLMLRQPGSVYESGRSTSLLKVKRFHDAEARVVGHQPGAGRHKGRLGAVLVELASGVQFAVGSGFTDAERKRPPVIGTVITFRYQELSDRGVPRFPTFVRVLTDVAAMP